MTLYFERKLFDDSQRMRLQIMMTLGLDLITTAHLMPISLYKSCNVQEPQFSGMPSTSPFCLRLNADAGDACVEFQCLASAAVPSSPIELNPLVMLVLGSKT